MKKMTAINIDKWRTLNEDLFKGYVFTYDKLSKDNSLSPNETLVEVFDNIGIKGNLTKHSYGSAYTIAREIGIYYEDNGVYVLSKMAKAYLEGKLTYPDFLKYYCLNIEFLINEEVIHPFKEILEVLKNDSFNKDEIRQRVPKLIPVSSSTSATDCLRLFLNRCVDAELLIKERSNYSLNYNYNLLKGSLNVSNYSASEFENTFITGNAALTQKNIVTKLIERKITNLFEHSFYIKKEEEEEEIEELNIGLFLNKNETIFKSENIREFALLVFKHFFNDNWLEVLNDSKAKEATHNNVNYKTYHFDTFGKIIGEFNKPQNKESLTSSKTQRYFDELIHKEDDKYYYFTTQWNAANEDGRSFKNLKRFIENKFPEYSVIQEGETFILSMNQDKKVKITQIDFDSKSFNQSCENSGLNYNPELITRYIASLTTKPFVLLSGLSGSGKTKLAQAFAQWIAEDNSQYCIIPVGADWTNREPLLGYVNALDNNEYILPENGALKLLIEANKEENKNKPYFLILDEMNLSHVERYFADFLSVMESKDMLKLHSSENDKNDVPSSLSWPKNLFIVGTVNIDETTYMFSPKVLDRANVIEFRVNKDGISKFLNAPTEIDFTNLNNKGASMGENFVEIASKKEFSKVETEELNKKLVLFFEELKKTGAEFGYRSATEIHRLYNQLSTLDSELSENTKIDIAIMQKLLPKLHGSRRKLCSILEVLATFCVTKKDVAKAFLNNKETIDYKNNDDVLYPLSLEKITRMYKGAIDNGFASYAEA